MGYQSTRGSIKGCTFEEALYSGYTNDGGMLMPENIPCIDKQRLEAWSHLSYPQLVFEILSLYIPREEIAEENLKGILEKSYGRFKVKEVVKVANLDGDLNILELFHGPTMAIKDLSLSCIGQLLEYFLSRRRKHITILVGTSGDTGSAALESVRGLRWVDLVLLLPKKRCSKVQELQMTTVIEDNVHIFRVDGTSDDLDEPIKRCFTDGDFASAHSLSSINSINWARIVLQIAHHFYAYFQVCEKLGQKVEIVIPTGACGNVTAGCVAVQMGLPARLICAVNANDVVARTMATGTYSRGGTVVASLASAMDIQLPYNMERLFYMFSGMNTKLVREMMLEFESVGKVDIPTEILNKMRSVISCHVVNDEGIKDAMKNCWSANNYLLCPHTATAVAYHYAVTQKNEPGADASKRKSVRRVCLATASSAKFDEAVLVAGLTPPITEEIVALLKKPTRYRDMNKGEDWDRILRDTVEEITAADRTKASSA